MSSVRLSSATPSTSEESPSSEDEEPQETQRHKGNDDRSNVSPDEGVGAINYFAEECVDCQNETSHEQEVRI